MLYDNPAVLQKLLEAVWDQPPTTIKVELHGPCLHISLRPSRFQDQAWQVNHIQTYLGTLTLTKVKIIRLYGYLRQSTFPLWFVEWQPTSDPPPVSIQVRFGKTEDYPILFDLQNQAIAELCSSHYTPATIQEILQSQYHARLHHQELYFVAELDNQIVGFALLDSRSPVIGGVYVDPASTRQGIGSRLLQTLESEAFRKQIPVLSVLASLNAVAFYESRGYRSIQRSVLASSLSVVAMEKRLAPQINPKSAPKPLTISLMILLIILVIVIALVVVTGY